MGEGRGPGPGIKWHGFCWKVKVRGDRSEMESGDGLVRKASAGCLLIVNEWCVVCLANAVM